MHQPDAAAGLATAAVGVVLPKEALALLNAGNGDAVYLTEATDGGFRLTASNPEFARQLCLVVEMIDGSQYYREMLIGVAFPPAAMGRSRVASTPASKFNTATVPAGPVTV